MSSIISLFTGALGGVWGYLIALVIGAVLSGSGVGYVVHRMDAATIVSIKLADANMALDATRQVAAMQKAQDSIAIDAAVKEAQAQQKIVTHTVTLTKEITKHVTDTVPCVPYGAVRLLNDAATGSHTADAATSPAQSDDACAPVPWRDFVSDIIDDYGIGRQNAEQLNALESSITDLVKAANQ